MEPLVTVSASYGAGGSVIAPRLADLLGLPLIDRLMSAQASEDAAAAVRSEEGLTEEERASIPAGRILSYFARAASVGAMLAPETFVDDDDEALRQRCESALAAVARGAGAVVLGRAGAVVLAERPRTLHVRLDGPVERRVPRAADIEAFDPAQAATRQVETDKARTAFVKRLYRADPGDPRWYHLVLDTTVFHVDQAVDLVGRVARAFFAANP